MIIKTIAIGDKQIKFAASAGTLRRYRLEFNRDLIADFQALKAEQINTEVLENLAYVMAKQADPSIPNIDEWLDGFDAFDIISASQHIIALWAANTATASMPKKK